MCIRDSLWTTFQDMEVDSKDIRLFKLAEHYGIDYEKKQISVRAVSYTHLDVYKRQAYKNI